jgi:hypothetical protein
VRAREDQTRATVSGHLRLSPVITQRTRAGELDGWDRVAMVKRGGHLASIQRSDAGGRAFGQCAQGSPPNSSISLGVYKYVFASLGSLSWLFLLRIHPSGPSQSSLTHLAWLIHHLVRLESIQVHCFEWLHVEALGDCVSLWDSLVTLGGCHHLDGLVQRGSSSGGWCLSPALIMVIVKGSWAFPMGDHERHL